MYSWNGVTWVPAPSQPRMSHSSNDYGGPPPPPHGSPPPPPLPPPSAALAPPLAPPLAALQLPPSMVTTRPARRIVSVETMTPVEIDALEMPMTPGLAALTPGRAR